MLNLSPIIERLQAAVPSLARVAGIADYTGLEDATAPVLPAAFVMPAREQVIEVQDGAKRYRILVESFAVVIACQNVSDARGEAASEELRALADSVRGALWRWRPDSTRLPFEFSDAAPVGYTDQVLIWQETFTARRPLGVGT